MTVGERHALSTQAGERRRVALIDAVGGQCLGNDEDEVMRAFRRHGGGTRKENRNEGGNDEGLLVPGGHPFPFVRRAPAWRSFWERVYVRWFTFYREMRLLRRASPQF